MKSFFQFAFILLWSLCGFKSAATHLVGGEMTYQCLGNNNYQITLIIYRDCLNGLAGFDTEAIISTYNGLGQLVANDSVPIDTVLPLPLIAPNNCTFLPPSVCTEKGIYRFTLNLPPSATGYTITHQRCCRNNSITNINNANSQWGSTFTTNIPPFGANCNSSPKFNDDPPVVLCNNIDVTLDLSASDINNDSLYYELCPVLNGGANSTGMVSPNPAAPPPYQTVPFVNGFSANNPITSAPQFSIHPHTGILTGTPRSAGQFVFAICVSEYKNGVYLGSTRRDFQFNVSDNCKAIISRVKAQHLDPISICDGGYVQFTNLSQFASTYFWDFGDTTVLNDTSSLKHPSYFYQDTGTYIVTLIAEPNTVCADTVLSIFEIYDSTDVSYTFNGDLCQKTNSLNFNTSGIYSSNATFEWDFGATTNLGTTSTVESPKNVHWPSAGKFYVTITVNDFKCNDVFGDTITIHPNPIIGETVPKVVKCAPYLAEFYDQTVAVGRVQHWWYFGDGGFSTDPNPTHLYTNPGVYTVSHSIKSLDGCVDTGSALYPNVIEVLPSPTAGLAVDPHEQAIYNPVFNVYNRNSGHLSSVTYLPNGEIITNLSQYEFSMKDTGTFVIIHTALNEHNCTDTILDTIRVTAPYTLFMPNAFTPNGDGLNDYFEFKLSGVSSVHFTIYDRWGGILFSSTALDARWDGKSNGKGDVLPTGIYAFTMHVLVKEGAVLDEVTGYIALLR